MSLSFFSLDFSFFGFNEPRAPQRCRTCPVPCYAPYPQDISCLFLVFVVVDLLLFKESLHVLPGFIDLCLDPSEPPFQSHCLSPLDKILQVVFISSFFSGVNDDIN